MNTSTIWFAAEVVCPATTDDFSANAHSWLDPADDKLTYF